MPWAWRGLHHVGANICCAFSKQKCAQYSPHPRTSLRQVKHLSRVQQPLKLVNQLRTLKEKETKALSHKSWKTATSSTDWKTGNWVSLQQVLPPGDSFSAHVTGQHGGSNSRKLRLVSILVCVRRTGWTRSTGLIHQPVHILSHGDQQQQQWELGLRFFLWQFVTSLPLKKARSAK